MSSPHLLTTLLLIPPLCIALMPTNLLTTLLMLESLTLVIILTMLHSAVMMSYLDSLNILIVLTMSASEASIGLSCLISMVASHGSDKTSSLMALAL